MPLRNVSLEELTIDDEASFAHVGLYGRLKQVLRKSNHRFRIPEGSEGGLSWDRALFLNLTFWSAEDGADVLVNDHIPADVVAHVAWHHLAATQLAAIAGPVGKEKPRPPSPAALLFAESIASAFDLYLVGRLLSNAPDSDFITTQVPIMSDVAEEAGLAEPDFAALMESVIGDPERAFEDLRALLFDVSRALLDCSSAAAAQLVFERFAGHRFSPLLHHYQLSNWILYARAYAGADAASESSVRDIDAAMRRAPVSLDWLTERWLG